MPLGSDMLATIYYHLPLKILGYIVRVIRGWYCWSLINQRFSVIVPKFCLSLEGQQKVFVAKITSSNTLPSPLPKEKTVTILVLERINKNFIFVCSILNISAACSSVIAFTPE